MLMPFKLSYRFFLKVPPLFLVIALMIHSLMFKRSINHQWVQPYAWKLQTQRIYSNNVMALAFSSDGRTLATAGSTLSNRSAPRGDEGLLKVEMLNVQSLRMTRTLYSLPTARYVAFSPDLTKLVMNPLVLEGLQLVDLTNGKTLWKQYSQKPSYSPGDNHSNGIVGCAGLAFSPHGDKIVSCLQGPSGISWAEWWFVKKQKLLKGSDPTNAEWGYIVTCSAFSPASHSFVVGGRDNTLILYDTKSYKTIWAQGKYIKGDDSRIIQTIAFSPNNKTIATGSVDKSVSLWNAQNGLLLRTLKVHSKPIQTVAFSPDSTMLASGSQDGTVVLSSTRNGETLHLWNAKHGAVKAFAFAPSGSQFAAGYQDGTVTLWRRQP